MEKPQQAFIGLGSNLGDGQGNLLLAWQRLGETTGISLIRLSSPYRTEPVGMDTDHWFTNAVGEIATALSPAELLTAMLAIETELGRDRTLTQDRVVDLDLLYYGDLMIQSPTLTVPHPRIAHRLFVLAPLAELAPAQVHPILGRSSLELCRALGAQTGVERQEWRYGGPCGV
ncbi:MAG: 2-amino-4-hydroxy-6-hydroxymethyldihydropteridine diphosphokinase [Desulfurivibrionaceae bacterium]|nr:2-amino-4-hydroxy-6-hydroxymethyldihydropteridine diphosphokinase [Pseudomonadota bacterium]MBU4229907.1 2-amino-4-hydroxy-6-hydroxymethyldihydropteridine diphosphokinase [Pseudomonadota bacterium]MCG2822836.1 2-amino-4-hydroxy-6-hydroxymethyldihydropteridine diphosphokinase [Desulfobulbaceae bacterium]MDP2001415.1 2-amino-4-hydroxy-6-hydroxymethyldihydropteridine diphosphokinase [Desulfurivibrionaceae bacterium]